MANAQTLKAQRDKTLELTRSGPPARTSNPFFGVGPITDGTLDEVDARLLRFEFDRWLEKNYRKLDDQGGDLGPGEGTAYLRCVAVHLTVLLGEVDDPLLHEHLVGVDRRRRLAVARHPGAVPQGLAGRVADDRGGVAPVHCDDREDLTDHHGRDRGERDVVGVEHVPHHQVVPGDPEGRAEQRHPHEQGTEQRRDRDHGCVLTAPGDDREHQDHPRADQAEVAAEPPVRRVETLHDGVGTGVGHEGTLPVVVHGADNPMLGR